MWLLDKFLKRAIKRGKLIVTDYNGKVYEYGPGADEMEKGPMHIRLTTRKASAHIAKYPQVGAGEAYMWGWMEIGEPYAKSKLHHKRYFYRFLDDLKASETDLLLLAASRDRLEDSAELARLVEKRLLEHPLLRERVARLQTIPGVGAITALTWAVEIGDPRRFRSLDRAVSYRGLCARLNESAGKSKRGPLSKQRNPHPQHVLIEAAKLAPRWNEPLARL